MATINSAKRNTTQLLDAGYKSFPRVLDFVLDMTKDVTMGSATDVINLGLLPNGATILAASVQQVTAGTGTGTLVVRAGSTALSGTLASNAPVGTLADALPAVVPVILPVGPTELNLQGAGSARTTGMIRVICLLVEGDRNPRAGGIAVRDSSL